MCCENFFPSETARQMQGTLAVVPMEDSTMKTLLLRLANIADFQSTYLDHGIFPLIHIRNDAQENRAGQS
jgi:hypothetical protein